MGFAPFPQQAIATRVGPAGGPFAAGDVPILGGIGTRTRASEIVPAGLVVDGTAAPPEAPTGLFLPGDVSALPSLPLYVPGSTHFLRIAQAVIAGTTPAAGTDNLNHHAIRLAGAGVGQQDLPLDAPGVRGFRFSAYDNAILAGQDANNAGQSTESGCAHHVTFQPTAQLTVTALGFACIVNGGDTPTFVDAPHRFVLMDADLNYLAVTPFHEVAGAGDWVHHALTGSVDLQQGQTYAVGIEMADPAIARTWPDSTAFSTETWNVFGSISGLSTAQQWPADPVNGSASIPAMKAAGIVPTEESDVETSRFRLLGAPQGVLLSGTVTISPITVGAPPNAPTDINLLMQWVTEI